MKKLEKENVDGPRPYHENDGHIYRLNECFIYGRKIIRNLNIEHK